MQALEEHRLAAPQAPLPEICQKLRYM